MADETMHGNARLLRPKNLRNAQEELSESSPTPDGRRLSC